MVLSKSGKPLVRLPYPPKASELEGVGVTLLFVLRTLLRLEQATAGEIAQCLPVGLAQVEDNLLFARSKGMLDVDVDGHVSISWRWDRAVRRALTRRNMTS